MKIVSVTAHYLEGMPVEPLPFREEPREASALLVQVSTDEGVDGHALVAKTEIPHRIGADMLRHEIGPKVLGRSVLESAAIWESLRSCFASKRPTWLALLAAVDVAIWDAKGKHLGLPLWRLFDGASSSTPAYAAFGVAGPNTGYGHLQPYGEAELCQEAKLYVDRGFTTLKTGVGRSRPVDLLRDVDRITALREVVGDNVDLMIDGSCQLHHYQAVDLLHRLEHLRLALFEEPVSNNDPAALRRVRDAGLAPIAANPWGGRAAYRALLDAGAVDILQPNVATIGLTESHAIAELCKAYGIPVMNGNGGGPLNTHLQAGMTNGLGIEYNWIAWGVFGAVFDGLPHPVDGYLELGERPGHGMTARDGLIEEHSR